MDPPSWTHSGLAEEEAFFPTFLTRQRNRPFSTCSESISYVANALVFCLFLVSVEGKVSGPSSSSEFGVNGELDRGARDKGVSCLPDVRGGSLGPVTRGGGCSLTLPQT